MTQACEKCVSVSARSLLLLCLYSFSINILLFSPLKFANRYMKTVRNTIPFFAAAILIAILFSNCKKEASPSGNRIQQGNTTIEINAIFPKAPGSSLHFLQVRYNDVINAPIDVSVTFHLTNGQQKNIPVTIPAGYRNLVSWGGDNHINTLDYAGHTDSTGNGSTPVVDGSWDVSSVEITAVSCPDKEYGFKVLTGADQWTHYVL